MTDNFYKAFEDAFRGDRDTIMERLKVYLPLIEPLKTLNPTPRVLDVGCGRGEWLQLLNQNGFHTHGVDLDESMLQNALEYDLSVECRDAIEYLRSLPDASLELISGFHIAEHLPFEALLNLFFQAERVLVRGGVIILETPNPENITVGSNTFYTDPTHQRPIPPALLKFLFDNAGFANSSIIRLNGADYGDDAQISLFDVIAGASPDYAVIASTSASHSVSDTYRSLWSRKYGYSMDELALRYSKHSHAQYQNLQTRIDDNRYTIDTMREQTDAFSKQIDALSQKTDELSQRCDHLNEQKNLLSLELDGVYHSLSWRITAPLRHGAKAARELKTTLKNLPTASKKYFKKQTIKALQHIVAHIKSSPKARPVASKIANRIPRLAIWVIKKLSPPPDTLIVDTHSPLSHRGERIYHDLKHAIEEARSSR